MESLGIDLKLLLAQIINFLILLLILKKFLYKPIIDLLSHRKQKIAKSIEDNENAAKALAEATARSRETIGQAVSEAQMIIQKSQTEAKQEAQKIINDAQKRSDKMIEAAQKQSEKEKNKAVDRARARLGDLVALAVEKIVGTSGSSQSIEKAIDEIE